MALVSVKLVAVFVASGILRKKSIKSFQPQLKQPPISDVPIFVLHFTAEPDCLSRQALQLIVGGKLQFATRSTQSLPQCPEQLLPQRRVLFCWHGTELQQNSSPVPAH